MKLLVLFGHSLCLPFFVCSAAGQSGTGPSALPSEAVAYRFSDVPVDMTTGRVNLTPPPDFVTKSRGLNLTLNRKYSKSYDEDVADVDDLGMFGRGWRWQSFSERLKFHTEVVDDNEYEYIDIETDQGTVRVVRDYEVEENIVPGTDTVIFHDLGYVGGHARTVYVTSGWDYESRAVGKPDGRVSTSPGFATAKPLVAGNWGLPTFKDSEREIVKVELTSIGGVQYPWSHPLWGARVKLSAGGRNAKVWSHAHNDWDTVDITSDQNWTWAKVNNTRAILSAHSHKGSVWHANISIDAFYLEVTYRETRKVVIDTTTVEYDLVPKNTFLVPKGATFTFQELGSGTYEWGFRDGSKMVFDSEGYPLEQVTSDGEKVSISFEDGKLMTLQDDHGQTVSFDYLNADPFVDKATLTSGDSSFECQYTYDEHGNMTEFINVQNHKYRFDYFPPVPENPKLSHCLHKITGPEPLSYTQTFEYCSEPGAEGKVKSFENAAGDKIRFAYGDHMTYSFVDGEDSYQGVEFNQTNDIIKVFLRKGHLDVSGSDSTSLYVQKHATSVEELTGTSSSWSSPNRAVGESDNVGASHIGLQSGEDLVAGGWVFDEAPSPFGISRVVVSVRGKAKKPVVITAGGPTSNTLRSDDWEWVELDVTSDNPSWNWSDVNDLSVRITKDPDEDPSDVDIDAIRLSVHYQQYDPTLEPEDKVFMYDQHHNIVCTLHNGATNHYTYDDDQNLLSHTRPDGGKVTYTYRKHFEPETSHDPTDPSPLWTRVETITDPFEVVTKFIYDDKGKMQKRIEALETPRQREFEWTYNPEGVLQKEIDALGHAKEYIYDPQHIHVMSIKTKRGHQRHFDYDSLGNRKLEEDAENNLTFYEYNKFNDKTLTTDPTGVKHRQKYDVMGRVGELVSAEGDPEFEQHLTFFHDKRGNVIRQVDGRNHATWFSFDVYGNKTSETNRMGEVTQYEDDLYGRVTTETDAEGHTRHWSYDGSGNVTSYIDQRGNEWTTEYNFRGQPTRKVDPGENVVIFTYDLNGNLVQEEIQAKGFPGSPDDELPESLVTLYDYDELGNRIRKIVGDERYGNRVYTMDYDAMGQVRKVTDPLGHYVLTDYDEAGNVSETTLHDKDGTMLGKSTFKYDGESRLRFEHVYVDADTDYVEETRYDKRGLKKAKIDRRNHKTSYRYDPHRNFIHVTNAVFTTEDGPNISVITESFAYDAAKNRIFERDKLGLETEYIYDKENRLTVKKTGVNQPANQLRTTRYAYDKMGGLTNLIDSLGHAESYSYDEAGNRILRVDKRGYASVTEYDELGRATTKTDPLNHVSEQLFDGRGLVCRQIDKREKVTKYRYDVFGQLLSVEDPEGNQLRYEYDLKGQKIAEVDPRGVRTRFTYDGAGRLVEKSVGEGLPSAMATSYRYDWLGRLLEETDPLGHSVAFAYDENGNVVKQWDKRGKLTQMEYDVLNRLTRIIDPANEVVWNGYDPAGNITTITDQLLNQTLFQYDTFGQLTKKVDAEQRIRGIRDHGNAFAYGTTYEYDVLGRMIREEDARGNTTVSTYDEVGNVIALTSPRGHTSTIDYDPLNRVKRTIDPYDHEKLTWYDEAGNVLVQTDKAGYATTHTYTDNGRLYTTENRLGYGVTNEYDVMGNKILEMVPKNYAVRTVVDEFNRVVAKVDGDGRPDARTTRSKYDVGGRLIRVVDPSGFDTTYTYDEKGNPLTVTDARGYTTINHYDDFGRVYEIVDPKGATVFQEYDEAGRLKKQRDKRGAWTEFHHDAVGRVTKTIHPREDTDPMEVATRAGYDLVGNLVRQTNALGVVTAFEYDKGNLLTKRTLNYGKPDARVETTDYDALGRIVKATDAEGDFVTPFYDSNDNVIRVENFAEGDDPDGPPRRMIRSEYDELNQLKTVYDAENDAPTRYEVDEFGHRTKITDPEGGTVQFVYDVYGNQTEIIDQLGETISTEYDKRNLAIKVIDPLGSVTTFSYDANGNRITESDDDGNTVYTTYDELNRVVSVNRSMANIVPGELKRADVNRDGVVDEQDYTALDAIVNGP